MSRSKLRSLSHEQTAEVIAELSAIMASDSFSSSTRCRDFLEFVVRHALEGDYENLTERFLGVELFGRAVDYETSTDAIVRVRANDVRRRLGQYYASRKSAPPVRIDLIAGGYIPEFHWRAEKTIDSALAPAAADAEIRYSPPSARLNGLLVSAAEVHGADQPKTQRPSSAFWWICVAGALVVSAGLALVIRPHRSNFDRFWQPVLNAPSSPVLILPTTNTFQFEPDAMQRFSQLKPSESMSLASSDVQDFHNWHVSLPVLEATLSVALALERNGKTPLVRLGTDLKMDELRGHPIISIGSFSNPWTQQNVTGLRFTFDRGASDREPPRIRDTRNPARSWSLPSIYPEPQDRDYAIITRTFDPLTHAPFVSLAGLHSFGNEIAGEFVSRESFWNELAGRAPAGWENMNLQIVLETNMIGTTPSSPKIVDAYFWK